MRLAEIIRRMKEIEQELRSNEKCDIDALKKEFDELKEEKRQTEETIEERNKLIDEVTNSTSAMVVKNFSDKEKEDRTKEIEEKEYRTAFLKNLMGAQLTENEQRAFVHTTENTEAVVPKETLNQIYSNLKEMHPILDDIQYLRSNAVITIVKHTSIVEGDAKEVKEAEANEDEQNTFVNVSLNGKDFSKHIDFSYRLGNMSIPAFEQYLATELADRLASALADDTIAQMKNDIHADNKITSTGLTDKEIRKAFGSLKNVGNVVVYANNNTIWNVLAGLEGADGKDAFAANYQDNLSGRLYGRAVKEEDSLADGEILIVDPQQYLFSEVQPLLIERDQDIKKHVKTISGLIIGEGTLTNDKAGAIITVNAAA